MKFAKRLQREALEEWRASYINYKLLKRAIATAAEGDVSLFKQLLVAEIQKVSSLYGAECDKLTTALDELERVVRPGGANGAAAPPPSPTALSAAQRSLVASVVPALGALRLFVVLNYTAVVKAVKKWNKHGNAMGEAGRLDAVTLLLRAPFFNAAVLARAVTRAEMLAASLAPAAARSWTDFACPICLEVLRNPVVLSCAHRFCFSCVATAALYSVERATPVATDEPRGLRCDCPVCRKPQILDEGALQVDPALDDFVREHFGTLEQPPPLALHAGDEGGDKGALARAPAGAETEGVASIGRGLGLLGVSTARVPKLLLLGIDGCRGDALLVSDAPAARALVCGGGAFSMHATCGGTAPAPGPAWDVLLTGRSDGGSLSAATLFHLLLAARPWLRHHLVTSKPQLAARCAGGAVSPEPAADDARAATAAAAALSGATAPDVLVLQLGEVQAIGVKYGFGPHVPEYREAIALADRRLAMLLDVLRRRCAASPAEDWLVLVTSTGGGTSRADMPPQLAAVQALAEWRRAGDGPAVAMPKPGAPSPPAAGPSEDRRGAFGAPGLPPHESAFVLLWGRSVRCGEILPAPRAVDAVPAALAHFGVLPRPEWALQGSAWPAVAGAAGWSRASHRLPALEEAAPTEDALGPSESALNLLSVEEAAAAAAAVACGGGLALAFFASVPGLLDPHPMAVVGHRGAGMNAGSREGAAVRENTIASFNAAAAAGATWVEMDVQVSADGVPVIWHDDEVLARRGAAAVESFSVRRLTATSFRALGPPPAAVEDAASLSPAGVSCALLRRFRGAGVGGEQPWSCPQEDRLPTLSEALRLSNPALGFNLELKFVEDDPLSPPELEAFLGAVLATCERYAGSRRLVFSSFDPDAAAAMRRRTARWPVMLLSDAAGDAGSTWPLHSDARRNGVRTALQFAVAAGLAGLVVEVDALLAQPGLVPEIRAAGMLLGTWGASNTRRDVVRLQAAWGVCACITDAVPTAVAALGTTSEGGPRARPAVAPGAAAPAIRSAIAALPEFLGGRGALPDALLQSQPLTAVIFSGHDGSVSSTFAPDGSVVVRQTPLPEDRALGQRVLAAAMAAPRSALTAPPADPCTCRTGTLCTSCTRRFGGAARAAAAHPLPPPQAGATASIAARGSRGGAWAVPAATLESAAASAAPRAPANGLRLTLAQVLLPSPRLWRAA